LKDFEKGVRKGQKRAKKEPTPYYLLEGLALYICCFSDWLNQMGLNVIISVQIFGAGPLCFLLHLTLKSESLSYPVRYEWLSVIGWIVLKRLMVLLVF